MALVLALATAATAGLQPAPASAFALGREEATASHAVTVDRQWLESLLLDELGGRLKGLSDKELMAVFEHLVRSSSSSARRDPQPSSTDAAQSSRSAASILPDNDENAQAGALSTQSIQDEIDQTMELLQSTGLTLPETSESGMPKAQQADVDLPSKTPALAGPLRADVPYRPDFGALLRLKTTIRAALPAVLRNAFGKNKDGDSSGAASSQPLPDGTAQMPQGQLEQQRAPAADVAADAGSKQQPPVPGPADAMPRLTASGPAHVQALQDNCEDVVTYVAASAKAGGLRRSSVYDNVEHVKHDEPAAKRAA
ncbi:hypothetical protein WJX72_002369 [[Myrmecia] bisecta]|uniref:Uncharacterized protein n=1 Tax=[Myrmecia] bisecta TaxID=41462 RepID=A0AAW1P4M1_9CHLO